MKILIKRTYFREDCTIGFLMVDGKYFCDTLEPHAIPWVDNPYIGQKAGKRVAGKTAIPEGTYQLDLIDSLTHKRPMPCLKAVPRFKTVLIRTGTDAKCTRGDILVGTLNPEGTCLTNSLSCFKALQACIMEAAGNAEEIVVTVRSVREWGIKK